MQTLHTPVSGTIKKIDTVRNAEGRPVEAVIIETEQNDAATESALNAESVVECVKQAGIVGLGGAAFPTHVKLTPPKDATPTVVLINGAECEPYLTCDDALMQRSPREIVLGTRLLMQAVNVEKAVIGIEENKPEAISKIKSAINELGAEAQGVSVEVLKKKYPQGGEKQLIDACLGKRVPDGGLPVAVGAIVDNVATVYAVYDAVKNGNALTHRVVCVTGPELTNPGNFLVPIGTPISTLLELAGGVPENTGKIISGGPMMGRAISNLDAPTVKGMSGILVLPESQSNRSEPQPCIRCGKCVDVCPMGLEPYLLARLSAHEMWEETKQEMVMSCVECGSCSYVCPSFRPLLDYIRMAKRKNN